ncbi:MAG: hypothetical protein NT067_03400 [Candidatus Diapherotrites archaeon]|nr:hypothetical protein [Candidatus Diapherotrites archaeon]
MVHRPLPSALIARLRAAERKISPRLGAMKNSDARVPSLYGRKPREWPSGWQEMDAGTTGFRVREMNVSRNFPGVRLVLKRPHGEGLSGREPSAQDVIDRINGKVRLINEGFHPKDFELRAPFAYAVGNDLIAMRKTNAPTLRQVLYGLGKKEDRARRTLSKKGITSQDLSRIERLLDPYFASAHLWVFLEKGKLVLEAVPDLC